MKTALDGIERISSRLLRLPLGGARGGSGATELEVVLVDVESSEGVGSGFTYSLRGGGRAVRTLLDELAGQLGGMAVDDWDRRWHDLASQTHRLGRGVCSLAISALDIAVWDLRARVRDVPLHVLLGSQRTSVPVYGSGRATHQMSTDELVEGSLSYVDEGFRAVKLRAGALGLTEDVRRVAAVREAVGSEVLVMVDCNERLDLPAALWLGQRLADLDVLWLEEPIPGGQLASYERLASQLTIPIATGEHLQGRFEFAEVARRGAAHVLQPDAPLVGGVSEWIRIAEVADALGVAVSPHFLPELHVHLAAAARACTWVEHFPLLDPLLEETLAVDDGVVSPPPRAGHGMLWADEAVRRYEVL